MVSHHKKVTAEFSIKPLTLVSITLLLHVTILWPEAASTMMWSLLLKIALQIYKRLHLDEDWNTSYQKFASVELQICTMDYHTWGCSVFILEAPM